MNQTARKNIDSSTDLGPLGFTRTDGRCNYQWGVTGPLGGVLFYCTNDEACDGRPHRTTFGSGDDAAAVEWRCSVDLAKREPAPELFYLLSVKHGAGCDEFLWWGPDSCGYRVLIDEAGKYTREQIEKDRRFCNEGTLPVPCAVVDAHARRVIPRSSGVAAQFRKASFDALGIDAGEVRY